ncbi:ABC-F family ATP-binding cassette domain-containing protein [Mesotoga prima]|uniref:ABC-F family ATP-binding cassette domain-containing protein n=1 Tax=Mesotoga prima TaxID=1184387 RepID=UPI002FE06623
MVSLLHIKNISVSFDGLDVLKSIDLDLSSGEIVALTGPNGSGKTTLLKVIFGELLPSSGSVQVERGVRIAYVNQEPVDYRGTVEDYLLGARPALLNLHRKMESLRDYPIRYAEYINDYHTAMGFEFEEVINRKLSTFGFQSTDLKRDFGEFSQGQRRILSILKALLSETTILLLDEPTNHLDIAMTVKLEGILLSQRRDGIGIIVVSHDRTFIDRVADRTVYLKNGESVAVNGGYTMMLEHLDSVYSAKQKQAMEIDRKIRQLEAEIVRRKNWSASKEASKRYAADKGYVGHMAAKQAKRALAVQKRTEKLIGELRETKPFVEKPVSFSKSDYSVPKRKMLGAEGVAFSYGDERVLLEATLDIDTTDRIGIIGANGSGKTTLMKCLIGLLEPFSGEVYRNENVNWKYIPQNVISFFERETLLDELFSTGIEEVKLRSHLANVRLRGERILSRVSDLSYGELMRAAILKATLSKAEFIFMDEPTNHLDIESLEVLDDLLDDFPGGFLFISHDRQFIARHGYRLLIIENGILRSFETSSEIDLESFRKSLDNVLDSARDAEIRRRDAGNM